MPGPGGGSHGGGGHSGGFSGGGHSGGFSGGGHSGGFSGTPHGGGFNRGGFHGGGMPPPHHGGGWHGGWHGPHFGGGWRRPRHYGNGGCFGGIITIVIVIVLLVAVLKSGIEIQPDYGYEPVINDIYDENTFQDYADSQYKKEFGQSDAYEDNILLVFLTEENTYSEYYYIAWVGAHIETDINYLFGNEETVYGKTVLNSINTSSYKYSLDSNIADVVSEMSEQIKNLNLSSSFNCTEEHNQVQSHLTNHTSMDITADTVNNALTEFTNATGIPLVVVVDDIDNVFTSSTNVNSNSSTSQTITYSGNSISSNAFLIVVIVAVVILAAVAIVFIVKRKKKHDRELENDN